MQSEKNKIKKVQVEQKTEQGLQKFVGLTTTLQEQ